MNNQIIEDDFDGKLTEWQESLRKLSELFSLHKDDGLTLHEEENTVDVIPNGYDLEPVKEISHHEQNTMRKSDELVQTRASTPYTSSSSECNPRQNRTDHSMIALNEENLSMKSSKAEECSELNHAKQKHELLLQELKESRNRIKNLTPEYEILCQNIRKETEDKFIRKIVESDKIIQLLLQKLLSLEQSLQTYFLAQTELKVSDEHTICLLENRIDQLVRNKLEIDKVYKTEKANLQEENTRLLLELEDMKESFIKNETRSVQRNCKSFDNLGTQTESVDLQVVSNGTQTDHIENTNEEHSVRKYFTEKPLVSAEYSNIGVQTEMIISLLQISNSLDHINGTNYLELSKILDEDDSCSAFGEWEERCRKLLQFSSVHQEVDELQEIECVISKERLDPLMRVHCETVCLSEYTQYPVVRSSSAPCVPVVLSSYSKCNRRSSQRSLKNKDMIFTTPETFKFVDKEIQTELSSFQYVSNCTQTDAFDENIDEHYAFSHHHNTEERVSEYYFRNNIEEYILLHDSGIQSEISVLHHLAIKTEIFILRKSEMEASVLHYLGIKTQMSVPRHFEFQAHMTSKVQDYEIPLEMSMLNCLKIGTEPSVLHCIEIQTEMLVHHANTSEIDQRETTVVADCTRVIVYAVLLFSVFAACNACWI